MAEIKPFEPDKDSKAELALIVKIHDEPIQKKQEFCKLMDLPWEEYQRLLRKWSRVIARWEKERRRIL